MAVKTRFSSINKHDVVIFLQEIYANQDMVNEC